MIAKKLGIGSLFLAMFLVCMAFVPAVSAETLTEDAADTAVEKIKSPVPEPEPTTVPDTMPESPYRYLLEADNEEQEILFSYIENCYVSDEEKKEMKKAMKDIWKRGPDQITEQDNLMLDKVAKSTAEYLNDKYGNVGIKWSGPNMHGDIIHIACIKWGVSTSNAQTANNSAPVPDTWNSGFWQSYNHYYDPVLNTGYAPTNCANRANIAKDYYNSGQYTSAYQHLGYSSHYMADLGNPMHTGKESEQYLNQWVHTSYESYVANNWNTGYNYKNVVQNTGTYYSITNPEQSAKNLASATRSDLNALYDAVFYYPDTFGSDSDVIEITQRVLGKTAKYNMGLVKYVRG
ncbi:phospholipase C/P1 nuclease family protein [Methanosarcina mazei]|jgi:hypothetical protein|uniref:Phospholipase C n=7 Tax=Methanosarcina mazei TaxID=2209 RepID=A0A0F8KG14_METMZ|nr:hypothetical protein [Methanosarcina mazei]AGF96401.1 hypothetical protein MmTuc01_1002 [Methanosarcina mazei Tuc01]AKB39344.1 hypothetical protein MSMAW_0353 [Methanosarcina mazei WWM610]AKB60315.1 hypothetical protein MSMAP_0330 [Methanosarcina mazei SarPi]AKB63528.1 hypothetical protein MSMAS_0332 [Methanosarcina mazei S-6]AKB66888.1 hypothetical protein MSMAL_0345 [Methanosarcina mazei LYC]